MVKAVNVPAGWNTLIFEGRRTAGIPRLFAQQNGGSYTSFVDAGLVDSISEDTVWRLPFWNPTPGLAIKVGFLSSAVGDALNCTYIGLARGLHIRTPPELPFETVSALPTPGTMWLGRKAIVRAAGIADTTHLCLRNASGNAAWVKIA